MTVRIRLARFGRIHRPFYRVVVADSKTTRDGKNLEVLGKDGEKKMALEFERVKYWLSVGAQPSEPVERLLLRAGLLPPPPVVAKEHKGGPRATPHVDASTGDTLNQEQPANANHNEDDGISPEAIFSIGLQVK